MATISRGILGGFRGKIGNVIGSSWKGIDSMRSMPISVANPRTNAQTENRTRFADVSVLLSTILTTIVKPLNDRFAQKMSGYNMAAQRSKGAFDSNGNFVPAELILSKGKLGNGGIITASQGEANKVSVSFDTALSGNFDSAADKAFVTIIGENGEVFGVSSGAVSRSVGTVNVDINVGFLPVEDVWAYLSFLKSDGTIVSDQSVAAVTLI